VTLRADARTARSVQAFQWLVSDDSAINNGPSGVPGVWYHLGYGPVVSFQVT
jgi:hypothetical protein